LRHKWEAEIFWRIPHSVEGSVDSDIRHIAYFGAIGYERPTQIELTLWFEGYRTKSVPAVTHHISAASHIDSWSVSILIFELYGFIIKHLYDEWIETHV